MSASDNAPAAFTAAIKVALPIGLAPGRSADAALVRVTVLPAP